MNNLLHYQNVSHYQKVKKTTEVLIILICSQKIKVYCLRKLIACVQIAERSASAGISYSQLQIQILLQKMSSMMRIFPIISWSKVKKTTEVIILIYSKASRYTASTYTDFTDTRFLIGSRNIRATLILSLFFTDTRFF